MTKKHLSTFGIGPIYVFSIISITVIALVFHKTGMIRTGYYSYLNIPFKVLGVVLILIGTFLWVSAVFKSKITANIKKNKLVTTGVFSIVRNPIYSAFMLACWGVLLLINNLWFLILFPIYWGQMTIMVVKTEEKWLKNEYQQKYVEYCKNVNRCIPWFPKRKRNKFLKDVKPFVEEVCKEKTNAVMEMANKIYKKLESESVAESEELKIHSRGRIYPGIAVFKALIDSGLDRDSAANVIHKYYMSESKKAEKFIKTILLIPGFYRKVPRLAYKATTKNFGEMAGFKANFLITTEKELRFDMLECPYFKLCKEHDCLEIVTAYCDADDICYGNMHKKLIWNRTKTLGKGDDCCDFNIKIQ